MDAVRRKERDAFAEWMVARFALWGVVALVFVAVALAAYGLDRALTHAGIASLSWRLLLLAPSTYLVFVAILVAWFGLYTRGHGRELVTDFRREAPKLPKAPRSDLGLRRKLKKKKKPLSDDGDETVEAEAWVFIALLSTAVVLAGPVVLPIAFLFHGRTLLARILYEFSVLPRNPVRSLVEMTGRYLLLATISFAVYAGLVALTVPGAENLGDVWRSLPNVDWGAFIDALGDD